LEKDLTKLIKESSQSEKKLANEDFLRKAPAEIVAKEKDKIAALGKKMEKLSNQVRKIREMMI